MTSRPAKKVIQANTGRQRVRVWFGEHTIADYCGEPEHVARYTAAMQRRFAGLHITTEPIPTPRGLDALMTYTFDTAPQEFPH